MGDRMARHRTEEVDALEGIEACVGGRAHGRGPGDVAKQGDLAEEVSRTGKDTLSADVDRQLAGVDEIEAVADVALANHDVSECDVDLNQMRRDSLLGDERQRREDRGALD